MRAFLIILTIALIGFIIWCAKTDQPKETNFVNFMSLMVAIQLIRASFEKKT